MILTYEQTLLQAQLEIQEQTLRFISKEIHDNVGQVLSVVKLNLGIINATDSDTYEKINYTKDLVSKAITDLRYLSKKLNPERIVQVGLAKAIEEELKHIEKTGDFATSLEEESDLLYLPADRTIITFRIVQELLNTIINHSEATDIHILITNENGINKIVIKDNGKQAIQEQYLTLENITDRANLINVSIEFSQSEDKYNCLTLNILNTKTL
ncbi:sensor histidine kinase [Chitinophagaceae bacterium LWZ2-11]